MRRTRSVATAMLMALWLMGCDEKTVTQTTSAPPSPTPGPIEQLPVNETTQLPGLSGTTDVVFDEHGIPHVFAPSAEAALFVQGYLTASVRFWEMDAFRRVAEGRLSELLGRVALGTDVGMRTVFTSRDGRRLEEALWDYVQRVDPELARLEEAYSSGVNSWLADLRAGRNGATLPPEYRLAPAIDETAETLADWRPQDTVAIARFQAYSLSETLEEEIGRARIVQALPLEIYKDVFRSAQATTATVLPPVSAPGTGSAAAVSTIPQLPPPALLGEVSGALHEMRAYNPFGTKEDGVGSNNWIVSPALSANGHAMLANDPHLQLFNPAIWHMIQLDAGSAGGVPLRANGVIFPGLPGIILGHNDFGAWGGTVAEFDVTDVYLEDVTTPAVGSPGTELEFAL